MILTFEKIRDLQRNEKDSKNLQELPKNFFQDVNEYLNRTKDNYSRFVVEDLIDMRIRKIVNLAINYFKTKEIPKNLLEEERKLYDIILNYISNFRKNVLEGKSFQEEGIAIKIDEKTDSLKDNIQEIKNLKIELEVKKEKNSSIIVEKDIGPFVGPDLLIYNLKKGERVTLPEDLKNLLIKYGYCKVEE